MPELERLSPSRAVEVAPCAATAKLVGRVGLELYDCLTEHGSLVYCRLPSPSRRESEPAVAQYRCASYAARAVKLSRAGELLLDGERLDVRPATGASVRAEDESEGKEALAAAPAPSGEHDEPALAAGPGRPVSAESEAAPAAPAPAEGAEVVEAIAGHEGEERRPGATAEVKEPKPDGSFWLDRPRLKPEARWWALRAQWQEWAKDWSAARRWQRAAKERQAQKDEKTDERNQERVIEPGVAAKASWEEVEEQLSSFSQEHGLDEACRSWLRDRPRAVLLQVMHGGLQQHLAGRSPNAAAVKCTSNVTGVLWDRGEYGLLEDFIQRQALDNTLASRVRELPKAVQLNLLRQNLGAGAPGSKGARVSEYIASVECKSVKKIPSAAKADGKKNSSAGSRKRPRSLCSADTRRRGGRSGRSRSGRKKRRESPWSGEKRRQRCCSQGRRSRSRGGGGRAGRETGKPERPEQQPRPEQQVASASKDDVRVTYTRHVGRIAQTHERFCFLRCIDVYKTHGKDVFVSYERNPRVAGLPVGATVAFSMSSEHKRPSMLPEAVKACEHKMGARNALNPTFLSTARKDASASPRVASKSPAAAASAAERGAGSGKRGRKRLPSASNSPSRTARAGAGDRKAAASHSDTNSDSGSSEERRRAMAARVAASSASGHAGQLQDKDTPESPTASVRAPASGSEGLVPTVLADEPEAAEPSGRRQPGGPLQGSLPDEPGRAADAEAATGGSSVLEVRGLTGTKLFQRRNPGKLLQFHFELVLKQVPGYLSSLGRPVLISQTLREAGVIRMQLQSRSLCAEAVRTFHGAIIAGQAMEVVAVAEGGG